MADNKSIIALEIGAQSVTMGVFTTGKKGLALARYARRDILLDPVEEGLRIEYVSAALGSLVAELKVKGSDVRDVVSGQQVFIRFIKLPPIESDDMDQLVGYEAQQHIPFPMEDIIWDYQELPSSEIGDKEVLLVAIKKEHLDSLNDQVESNGLQTKSVGCSITSLFNAFRHSYPHETQPVIILDIGAKTTDIIFSEKQRFFTRSVTAAGALVTNSISRDMRIPFKDAEALKINSGVISLTNGHTEGMSEQDAALASIIRNAMSRLGSEIQRTINLYRAQYHGNAPAKAYICGGGSLLTYTPEFLQETLGIPVEYMNPLNNIAVDSRIDENALSTDAVSLGGIAGAAVGAAGGGEFSIDLVPTSVARTRTEKQLLPKVAMAGAFAVVGAGVFAYFSHQAWERAQKEADKIQAPMSRYENIGNSIDRAETNLQKKAKLIDEFAKLGSARYAYADLLKLISEKTANLQFWLTDFSPLINYDPSTSDLVGGLKKEAVSVIDRVRSLNSNTSDSALSDPPQDLAKGRQKKADAITAIYIEGYTLKKDKNTQEHRQLIHDLVKGNLDGNAPGSPFTFKVPGKDQELLENQYITFIAADTKDQKIKVPDYADKFLMILPLKTPLPLSTRASKGK